MYRKTAKLQRYTNGRILVHFALEPSERGRSVMFVSGKYSLPVDNGRSFEWSVKLLENRKSSTQGMYPSVLIKTCVHWGRIGMIVENHGHAN